MTQGVVKSTTEAIQAIDNMKKTINGGLLGQHQHVRESWRQPQPENFAGGSAEAFYAEWPDTKRGLQTAIERLTMMSDDIMTVNTNIQTVVVTSSRPTVGDYELERQIGAGAVGNGVAGSTAGARSHGSSPAQAAAGRRWSQRRLERLRREATVLTELDHPHIVRVLEVLHDGDGIAVGHAVRARRIPRRSLGRARPPRPRSGRRRRRARCRRPGVGPPAGILLMATSSRRTSCSRRTASRCCRTSASPGPWAAAASDQVSGTAEYVAPELLDGAHPDPCADVYSLGVVCYQALVGQPPYTGPVPLAVVRAADSGRHLRLESLTHVPEALVVVVERAGPWTVIPSGASPRPTTWRERCGPPSRPATSGCRGPWPAGPATVGTHRAPPEPSVLALPGPSPRARGGSRAGSPCWRRSAWAWRACSSRPAWAAVVRRQRWARLPGGRAGRSIGEPRGGRGGGRPRGRRLPDCWCVSARDRSRAPSGWFSASASTATGSGSPSVRRATNSCWATGTATASTRPASTGPAPATCSTSTCGPAWSTSPRKARTAPSAVPWPASATPAGEDGDRRDHIEVASSEGIDSRSRSVAGGR